MTTSQQSDVELVRAAQAGRIDAFGTLIERHFGLVYTIAYAYLKLPEAAEDLAQEVFLTVYLRVRDLKNPAVFSAWLGRIARNSALNWRRSGQRASRLVQMVPLEDMPLEPVDSSPKAEIRQTMETAEEQKILREAILGLPDEQRELVLLHFMEDLDKKQIAICLGMHPSSVGRHLDKALDSLRKVLTPLIRQSFHEMRAPRRSVARATALVGAAALVSAKTTTAMAALIDSGQLAAATKATASATGVVGLIQSHWAAAWPWFAAGAKAMSVKQKVSAIVVVAGLVGGGGYYHHVRQQSQPAQSAPPSGSLTAGAAPVAPVQPPRDPLPPNTTSGPTFAEPGVVTVNVSGTVVDNGTGQAIPGALVRGHIVLWREWNRAPGTFTNCPYEETQTDGAGRYQLVFHTPLTGSGEMAGPDNLCVYASAAGYGSTPVYPKPGISASSLTFADVSFRLEKGTLISGQAVDDGGAPLADAVVQVMNRWNADWEYYGSLGRTLTDSAGNFRLWCASSVPKYGLESVIDHSWLYIHKPDYGGGAVFFFDAGTSVGKVTIHRGGPDMDEYTRKRTQLRELNRQKQLAGSPGE
jgi:RNA polymerase sigma-70 factor, ECF subfamily